MAVASLGPEYDLAKRISDLESIVRGLQTRDVLQNASIGAGGLTILNGGSLTVDGDATFNGSLTVPSGSLNTGGNLSAGGSVTAGTSLNGASLSVSGTISGATVSVAQMNASSGISSVGVYATDVSLLPGPRQAVWQNNAGPLGYSPSTIVKKRNLGPVQFTARDVLAVMPVVFQYVGQLDIRDNPDNPNHDPEYVVPWDVGFIAEQLVSSGLQDFVVFDVDGVTPLTVDYAGFGAVASLVVLQDHEARLRAAGI